MYGGAVSTHTTATRWYKGAPLALDDTRMTAFRTYGADSIVTESAPGTTAFASGVKASDKQPGVMPGNVTVPGVPVPTDETKGRPVASVLEAARLTGLSTGLVATSNTQHASPAASSTRWTDCVIYNETCEQQVYQDVDVVLRAGKPWLLPTSVAGGKRTDGGNLVRLRRRRQSGARLREGEREHPRPPNGRPRQRRDDDREREDRRDLLQAPSQRPRRPAPEGGDHR